MPGAVDVVKTDFVSGWARHPVHASYPMLVHALAFGKVIASTLADIEAGEACRFELTLPPGSDLQRTRVLLAETDELLEMPLPAPARRVLRVEDLLAVRASQSWVDGGCYRDAIDRGLSLSSVVTLLVRDYFGHADPIQVSDALSFLSAGHGIDRLRRKMIQSPDYLKRQIPNDRAPGSIFSQKMVMESVAGDFAEYALPPEMKTLTLPGELLEIPDNGDFVRACYLEIVHEEIARTLLISYLGELSRGLLRVDLVKQLVAAYA